MAFEGDTAQDVLKDAHDPTTSTLKVTAVGGGATPADVNVEEVGGTAVNTNGGNKDAGTQTVAVAEDDNVSTKLTDIDGKLPATLGQKASAASLAAVLSTEQETILTALQTALEKIDDVQGALKSVDSDELITRITDSAGAEINPAKEDGNLATITGDTTSIDGKVPADPAREGGNLASILTQLDITTSALRDAIRGANTKDFSTLETDVEAVETTCNAIQVAVETIDNFISGSRGLVTEDNSATILTACQAIQTAVEIIDNAISGNEMQVDVVTSALPSGASTDAKLDEVKALFGEVQASPTENTVLDRLKDLLTDIRLAANSGVDIGDVDVTSLPVGNAAMAASTPVTIASDDTLITALKTALETLDNMISGNEAQVDVITSALPTGAATETTLAAQSAKLPAALGQQASAASLATVLSTEQETILTALQTALQIIDDWDAVHDSAVSSDGPQVMAEAKDFDGAALPNTVAEGDAVRPAASVYGIQYVKLVSEDGGQSVEDEINNALNVQEIAPAVDRLTTTEIQSATTITAAETAIGGEIDVSQYNTLTVWVDYTNGDETEYDIVVKYLRVTGGDEHPYGVWSTAGDQVFTQYLMHMTATGKYYKVFDVKGINIAKIYGDATGGTPTGTAQVGYSLSNN